jgi:hypothetical protein
MLTPLLVYQHLKVLKYVFVVKRKQASSAQAIDLIYLLLREKMLFNGKIKSRSTYTQKIRQNKILFK